MEVVKTTLFFLNQTMQFLYLNPAWLNLFFSDQTVMILQ